MDLLVDSREYTKGLFESICLGGPAQDATVSTSANDTWEENWGNTVGGRQRPDMQLKTGAFADEVMKRRRHVLQIGAYGDRGMVKTSQNLNDLYSSFAIVETGPVNNAREDIPEQNDKWSCGINSAGRFMAMLGHPHPDFKTFHHHSPNHPAGHLETGPGTQRLAEYMVRHHSFGELHVGPNMTDIWQPQRDLIDLSISMSRPALVLVEVSNCILHWVNVIGRGHHYPYNYLLLNTDGKIYEFPGGEAILRQRMDLTNHMVHSIPLRNDRVARFNSITATNGALPEGRCFRRNMANGSAVLRHDRSAVHNVANTVLDSPVLLATPLAPAYLFWKLF